MAAMPPLRAFNSVSPATCHLELNYDILISSWIKYACFLKKRLLRYGQYTRYLRRRELHPQSEYPYPHLHNGESEVHSHPARITFYRLIYEVAYIRKGDYIVVTRCDFFIRKTEDGSSEVYIFLPVNSGLKPLPSSRKIDAPIAFYRFRREGQRFADNLE